MHPGTYDILAMSPIFKGIPTSEIKEMLKRVRHRVRRYKKGNIIAFEGDSCDELLILIKGTVKGEMADFTGKSVEIEMITAPRPLAPAFLFGPNNLFPVDVIADGEVTLLSIPRGSLISLFQAKAKILRNYLDTISSRAQFLSEKLYFMSLKTIKEKIAHYIHNRLKPGQDSVVLSRNQRELGEFFGVTRPSLSRIFAALEKEGIIRYDRKKVTVMDRDGFNDILKGSL
jgi:CRP-like cAMP-binding protein